MNAAGVLTLALLLGVGVPVLGMRLLAPSLAQGRTVENFHGRKVFLGLGIVWLLWAGSAVLGGILGLSLLGEASVLPILVLAGPLALIAFSLGLIDDAYGTGADRGFRGHVRALAHGRLTTGGMKLLGVSAASYAVALVVIGAADSSDGLGLRLLVALPIGAAIALTANFVNLTDLRPGRALKVYAVLAAAGVASASVGLSRLVPTDATTRLADTLALCFFAIGPLLATWRYDLGEQGMMGDSGANAAGAVAGLLIVAGLPLWASMIYLVGLLGLNLASERISFSNAIEKSAALRWLDGLGRLPDDADSSDAEEAASPLGTEPK